MTTVATTATRQTLAELAAQRRADAAATHAKYPQYAGHWDGWRIAEVTRRYVVKGHRVAFEKGDLALVSPDVTTSKIAPRRTAALYAQRRAAGLPLEPSYEDWPEVSFATVHSFRTGNDTAVRIDLIREVTVTDQH